MIKVGILSDTHGYMDDRILHHLTGVNEIWHAGDIGSMDVIIALEQLAPVRAVYGNIDGTLIRNQFPETSIFEIAGVKVVMTHIGNPPGKYREPLKSLIAHEKPELFICGHSHILMIKKHGNLVHLNPGAAGRHGFHHQRTLVKLELEKGKIAAADVVELGPRSNSKAG